MAVFDPVATNTASAVNERRLIGLFERRLDNYVRYVEFRQAWDQLSASLKPDAVSVLEQILAEHPATTPDELLFLDEAAGLVGMTKSTLGGVLSAHEVRGEINGRRKLVMRSDVFRAVYAHDRGRLVTNRMAGRSHPLADKQQELLQLMHACGLHLSVLASFFGVPAHVVEYTVQRKPQLLDDAIQRGGKSSLHRLGGALANYHHPLFMDFPDARQLVLEDVVKPGISSLVNELDYYSPEANLLKEMFPETQRLLKQRVGRIMCRVADDAMDWLSSQRRVGMVELEAHLSAVYYDASSDMLIPQDILLLIQLGFAELEKDRSLFAGSRAATLTRAYYFGGRGMTLRRLAGKYGGTPAAISAMIQRARSRIRAFLLDELGEGGIAERLEQHAAALGLRTERTESKYANATA